MIDFDLVVNGKIYQAVGNIHIFQAYVRCGLSLASHEIIFLSVRAVATLVDIIMVGVRVSVWLRGELLWIAPELVRLL